MSNKTYYVYSTLSNDQQYNFFKAGGADLPVREGSVLIKGKAGIATKNLVTPKGMATVITEAELEMLKKNLVFVQHHKNGFVTFDERQAPADEVADAVLNESGADPSSPLTPTKFIKGSERAVSSSEAKPAAKKTASK